MLINDIIKIHPEVADAVASGQPTVALESTVITHGLPHPDNLNLVRDMEQAIRDEGAIPATIAILKGVIHVGLSNDELEHLAEMSGDDVRKCSRRDLPIVVANKENGATTVAGTMIVANHVGIEMFATGGIGGVHRGAPFDVSADLTEFGRTPTTVVCGGPKSILDLAATREVLETQGVTLIGYQTDSMPIFFTRESEFSVEVRCDSAEQVANIIKARNALNLQSATIIGSPVPEGFEIDRETAEKYILQTQAEADAQGIHGAAATPFFLQRLIAISNGETLRANLALLKNNATVAAKIAVALAASA